MAQACREDNCQAALLLPSLQISQPVSGQQANALVLEPQTGQILALVGDAPADQGSAVLSGSSGRLPGDTFHLPDRLHARPEPRFAGMGHPFRSGEAGVKNFDGINRGPMRLRTALANDYLAPAQKLLTQVGKENIWQTAQQFGLSEPGGTLQSSPACPFFDR